MANSLCKLSRDFLFSEKHFWFSDVGHDVSACSYQYIFPTILHCSWVIKQSGKRIHFHPFSQLRARLKGSCTASLPLSLPLALPLTLPLSLSAIRRSGRLRARGRQGWGRRERGGMNSNCQIREKSLYLKWCSLCASLPARQFLFPHMKTCVCPLPLTPLTLCWWKVWVFGRHCWMENWHLWLCMVQANPFCLYLLTSIPKRQLAGAGISGTC